MKFMVGCDPELFIRHKSSGRFVSAHDIVPGSKKDPHKVFNGQIQPDGVAAEFGIEPTNESSDDFSWRVFTVVNKLVDLVKKRNDEYELVATPVALFDTKYFRRALPASAKALGCDPDYDAYTGKAIPKRAPRQTFRTGSGHLHIGWGSGFLSGDDPMSHIDRCESAVKQLDVALFIPSLLWDEDKQRRTLYGQIGSYRPKEYGVEYRPLSNAWVFKPELHKFIFNTIQLAMINHDKGVLYYDNDATEKLIARARKNEDISKEEVLDHYFDLLTMGMVEQLPAEFTSSLTN